MVESVRTHKRAENKEYRIRFDPTGKILGGSLHCLLGDQLGIALDPGADHDVFEYLERTATIGDTLPNRLKDRVQELIDRHEEFLVHGDFEVAGKPCHLHISGRVIENYGGSVVLSLLFLDDTEHTLLRRQYEYMFRLANHELKSPLACIVGAAEFADEHLAAGRTDGVKTCLEMIHRNSSLMEEMITRYMNLSRIESGAFALSPSDMRLFDDVVRPIIRELRPVLIGKDMEVRFESDDPIPVISADVEAASIVLRNLLSNAIKYGTAKTAIVVDLRLVDGEAVVSVENEGPNIPETQLARLFEKFVRLEATQGTKGAGLGLYNARRIVEMWGGRITVESHDEKTRFTFTIPQE